MVLIIGFSIFMKIIFKMCVCVGGSFFIIPCKHKTFSALWVSCLLLSVTANTHTHTHTYPSMDKHLKYSYARTQQEKERPLNYGTEEGNEAE